MHSRGRETLKGIAGTAFRRVKTVTAWPASAPGSTTHGSGRERTSRELLLHLNARRAERHDDRQEGMPSRRCAHDDLGNAYALLADRFPEETFTRDFIVEGAGSRRLQTGLRAVLVAVLIAIAAQEIMSAQRASDQTARHSPQPLVTSN